MGSGLLPSQGGSEILGGDRMAKHRPNGGGDDVTIGRAQKPAIIDHLANRSRRAAQQNARDRPAGALWHRW